jgi:hypothetical protein
MVNYRSKVRQLEARIALIEGGTEQGDTNVLGGMISAIQSNQEKNRSVDYAMGRFVG